MKCKQRINLLVVLTTFSVNNFPKYFSMVNSFFFYKQRFEWKFFLAIRPWYTVIETTHQKHLISDAFNLGTIPVLSAFLHWVKEHGHDLGWIFSNFIFPSFMIIMLLLWVFLKFNKTYVSVFGQNRVTELTTNFRPFYCWHVK